MVKNKNKEKRGRWLLSHAHFILLSSRVAAPNGRYHQTSVLVETLDWLHVRFPFKKYSGLVYVPVSGILNDPIKD